MTLSLRDELEKCVWWTKMAREVGPQMKETLMYRNLHRKNDIVLDQGSGHQGFEVWRKWSYPSDWPDALVKIKAAAKIQKKWRERMERKNIVSVPTSNQETRKKKTWNRNEKVEDDSWIISDKDLKQYEKDQNPEESPKEFLKRIYNDEGYIMKVGKARRGANAKNWKTPDGKFICASLHKANNIYDAFGKSIWSKKRKKGQQNRPVPPEQLKFGVCDGNYVLIA